MMMQHLEYPRMSGLATVLLLYLAVNIVRLVCGQLLLSRVSILLLTRDIDIVILSVRPSVRLSVTRWYCMKTA